MAKDKSPVGYCFNCRQIKSLYAHNNTYNLGLCKDCGQNKIDFTMENLQEICRLTNIPFDEEEAKNVVDGKVKLGIYIRNLTSLGNNDGYKVITKETKEKEDTFVVTDAIKERWGNDYTKEQLEALENHFHNLYAIKEPATALERQNYLTNSQLNLALTTALREMDVRAIPTLRKAYQDDCKALGLDTIMNSQNDMGESVGERLARFEMTEPIADINEYHDVEQYEKYIKKWMQIPLKRTFGMASEEEVASLYDDTE